MEKREEVIGDCRAVMEALADCGSIDTEMEAVSSEMEVTAGMIQKLVDENATRKLDQHDYRKKYDGYASRYAALERLREGLGKERERKEIQYDIFSGFLAGLSETAELPVDFSEKLFHRLVDYATVHSDGWCSPSATEWKSAWRLKAGSCRGIGFVPDVSGCFFCTWK